MTREPKIETIDARITGRYLVRSPAGDVPAPLLVGFHGYGENAGLHLLELSSIPGSDDWLVVSVQPLHRFYERKTGTVVGSWMTSEDREQMILDNLAYVDSVVAAVSGAHATTSTVVYSGFSQGVAMAYRAAILGRAPAAGIIALAGDVPPELQTDEHADWPRVLIGRGTDDPWYTQAKMDADMAFLATKNVSIDTTIFDGGHEWHDGFRATAGRLLQAVEH